MALLAGPITANGEYYFEIQRSGWHYFDVLGAFDGGTLVCSIGELVADGGRVVPDFDSLTAAATLAKAVLLPKGRVYYKLTGAGGSESITPQCIRAD